MPDRDILFLRSARPPTGQDGADQAGEPDVEVFGAYPGMKIPTAHGRADCARFAQDAEMMGAVRLAQPQCAISVGAGGLAIAIQQIKDGEPRRLGKGLEQRLHPNILSVRMRAIIHIRSIPMRTRLDKSLGMID